MEIQSAMRSRMIGLFGAIAAITLLVSTAAIAGERGDRAKAEAQMQEDFVTSVDVGSGTVTLGETTYRVADRSRLLDAEGRRMHLRELAGMDEGQMVRFQLRTGREGEVAELRRLEVMEGDFE